MERPRIHTLEDLSRSSFSQLCARVGWVVVNLSPDYGEDVIVFVYEDMKATGDVFFVQLKATDRCKSVPGRGMPISLQTKTLQRWQRLRLPVVLILYDAESEKLYWLEVAQHLASEGIDPFAMSSKTKRLHIPFDNELTLTSLESVKKAIYAIPSLESISRLKPFSAALRNLSQAVSDLEEWSISVIGEHKVFEEGTGIINSPLFGERLLLKSTNNFFGGGLEYEVQKFSCHDFDYQENLRVLQRRLHDLNHEALIAGLKSLPTHLSNLRTACVAVAKNLNPRNATAIIIVVANLVDSLTSIQIVTADLPSKHTFDYLTIAYKLRPKIVHFKLELERLKWAALDTVVE